MTQKTKARLSSDYRTRTIGLCALNELRLSISLLLWTHYSQLAFQLMYKQEHVQHFTEMQSHGVVCSKDLVLDSYKYNEPSGIIESRLDLTVERMPRVVGNQRAKFETDPVLQQLQEDCEIRYIDHCDCNLDERRVLFRTDCHEGSCKLGFVGNGVHLLLSFPKFPGSLYTSSEFVDFNRELGKVHVKCPLIFNGVCVKFYGWLDLQSLAGIGHLEFDETLAPVEHQLMLETLKSRNLPTPE